MPKQKEECATVCFSYFGVLSFSSDDDDDLFACFLVLRSICNENSIVMVSHNGGSGTAITILVLHVLWNRSCALYFIRRVLASHPILPHFFLLFSPARFSMNSIANSSLSFAPSLSSVSVEHIARVLRPNSQWIDLKSRRCDRSILYVMSQQFLMNKAVQVLPLQSL